MSPSSSHVRFVTPYGDLGAQAVSSVHGYVVASPYTDDDDA
jgi:hypothetical protein